MEVSIRLTHAAVPDIFSRQPKRPAAFHSFPLHVRMDIAFQSDIGVGMAQDFAESLDVAAALQAGGGKGMTKLVEATNGHSLVEAENAICYDIVRGYGLRRSLFGRGGVFLHGTKKQKTSVYRNV